MNKDTAIASTIGGLEIAYKTNSHHESLSQPSVVEL